MKQNITPTGYRVVTRLDPKIFQEYDVFNSLSIPFTEIYGNHIIPFICTTDKIILSTLVIHDNKNPSIVKGIVKDIGGIDSKVKFKLDINDNLAIPDSVVSDIIDTIYIWAVSNIITINKIPSISEIVFYMDDYIDDLV